MVNKSNNELKRTPEIETLQKANDTIIKTTKNGRKSSFTQISDKDLISKIKKESKKLDTKILNDPI